MGPQCPFPPSARRRRHLDFWSPCISRVFTAPAGRRRFPAARREFAESPILAVEW